MGKKSLRKIIFYLNLIITVTLGSNNSNQGSCQWVLPIRVGKNFNPLWFNSVTMKGFRGQTARSCPTLFRSGLRLSHNKTPQRRSNSHLFLLALLLLKFKIRFGKWRNPTSDHRCKRHINFLEMKSSSSVATSAGAAVQKENNCFLVLNAAFAVRLDSDCIQMAVALQEGKPSWEWPGWERNPDSPFSTLFKNILGRNSTTHVYPDLLISMTIITAVAYKQLHTPRSDVRCSTRLGKQFIFIFSKWNLSFTVPQNVCMCGC